MDEKITLKLSEPVQFGSETISELSFRKPIAKDFRNLPVGEITQGHLMDLASRLCGQPPSIIDSLCINDLAEVMLALGKYMGSGPKTGEKS